MSSTTPGGIEIGDVFNETDDDYETCKRIVSFNDKRDPPTVICCSIKVEDESEDTEEEYDLTYVALTSVYRLAKVLCRTAIMNTM